MTKHPIDTTRLLIVSAVTFAALFVLSCMITLGVAYIVSAFIPHFGALYLSAIAIAVLVSLAVTYHIVQTYRAHGAHRWVQTISAILEALFSGWF